MIKRILLLPLTVPYVTTSVIGYHLVRLPFIDYLFGVNSRTQVSTACGTILSQAQGDITRDS